MVPGLMNGAVDFMEQSMNIKDHGWAGGWIRLSGDVVANRTTATTSLPAPPSPPSIEHERIVVDQSEPLQFQPQLFSQGESLSPELSRRPPPRTPASNRSRETTSDYYTAVWGSPYEFSPSQFSRSARTAVSEQAIGDDFSELSPEPSFGLEHLVQSRLIGPTLHQPGALPLGKPRSGSDHSQTPRSRTQRWIQLPQRDDQSERTHWWSDDSVHSRSDSEGKRPRALSSTSSIHRSENSAKRPGHNSRESNRTLDQHSFWQTLRERRSDNMSTLLESRWAATPEPPTEPDSIVNEKAKEELVSTRWADTPEPTPEEPKEEDAAAEARAEEPNNDSPSSRRVKTPEPQIAVPEKLVATPVKPSPGMFASRWAATPEPDVEEEAKKEEIVEIDEQLAGSESVAKPDQSEEQDTVTANEEQMKTASEVPEIQHVRDTETSADRNGDDSEKASPRPVEGDQVVQETQRPESVVQEQTLPGMHLEPPRLKKRVSWRGKNIVITIPRVDYEAAGVAKPMSRAEISARLKTFEDAGFNINGHDLSHEETQIGGPAQVRDIFPSESEARALPSRDNLKVLLPDLAKWKAYTDWLTEQKLAALGVTLGFDEPAAPPSQDMSRQSSTQYPPLPFSPPIPSASAGSMGRPPMVRGHSHTMSMATPASPLNGPFGHMHRHSTVGGPGGFLTLQQLQQPLQQSPGSPNLPLFSPQQQFGLPGFPRVGSPAQLAALRQDLGNMRGPGSPLSQQMLPQSPQDYSRGLLEDQKRRQHGYSQSMYQPTMPNTFMSQASSIRQTPALPELPEDEEEDEEEELQVPEPVPEPELPAYVPPHKRVEAKTEIAVPTPRGHRHNISEGLERDLLEAEQRQKTASRDWVEVTEEVEQSTSNLSESSNGAVAKPVERDPLGSEHPVQETLHTRKKSASRFNVAAPAFTFNPGANFQPSASFQFQPPQGNFTFGAPTVGTNSQPVSNHNRHRSSGSFNVAAPAFQPASSEFSFSTAGPSFKPNGSIIESVKPSDNNIVDQLPSIFGKIQIPDIIKPARRNKAVAIVRPQESKQTSEEEFEDDEGRVAQGEAKRKQQRKIGKDGDQVPLFAEPTPVIVPALPPAEKILRSNDKTMPTVVEVEAKTEQPAEDIRAVEDHKPHVPAHHGHKHSASLSALAKPFEPPNLLASDKENGMDNPETLGSISDLEEGEIREDDDTTAVSPIIQSLDHAPVLHTHLRDAASRPKGISEYSSSERIDQVAQFEPSFDEIDAVMRQLNANDSEKEPEKGASPTRLPSPGSHPMKGVTYLAEWSRSDAPSPSPRRQLPESFNVHDRTDSGDRTLNGWSHVRQLNKAEEVPTSDWSGILSPPDEERLEQRSNFFDSHIDKVIGRVVEQRLLPLEESLRNIHSTVNKRNRSSDLKLHRSSSNVDSDADADDEDELSDERKQRPISRGKEKRVDQIKAAVLEALREQSPQRTQASNEIAELHSVLADMKVSFARAASASLELDDIRAVVEETLYRQSQAVVPVATDEKKESHRRELSELEGRLNETLAGALEEANQRRAIEEREADARRQARLAEEELQLVRANARDEQYKTQALEQERLDLIDRLERAEQARRDVEEKLEDSEASKDALHATLEEYRMSSNKWRQDIDEGKRIREELEATLADAQRQNEDYQDSTSSMARRLERLHSGMATAAGQLASEQAVWKSREEDYRVKIESMESQKAHFIREQAQLEDELRVVRATAVEGNETRHVVEQMRATNNSLDEMVRALQRELTEQQALATRYERQFHDAQESGRSEVHRTRMSMETEVEAANHQVNLVRAELEAELAKTRTELEAAREEAETTVARHEHLLEQEEATRREALRKVNHSNSVALDEARHKYEAAIQDLTAQQTRAISHALEDNQRMEMFLNEKLSLSDEKLRHYQDRVSHLEERLEVAKSAAHAAALNAKASKTLSPPSSSAGIPEKVSPQALRESILVLQEQLQERESRIERMQVELEEEGPAKVKERETEINWLRELLAVRSEELADLVNTISRPNFDRAAVRDTAIRIRANLQMEQQEKERFGRDQQTLSGQAIASLSSFATPKAAQLSSVFNKWRANMESSTLKSQTRPGAPVRSYTPSKTQPRPQPPRYSSGLMTPPASNLRSSPLPDEAKSLPPPRLASQDVSRSFASGTRQPSRPRSRHASGGSESQTTPLFREQSYDRDAEDQEVHMDNFEDDDLDDVADSEPPAFRSLEDELEASAAITEAAT